MFLEKWSKGSHRWRRLDWRRECSIPGTCSCYEERAVARRWTVERWVACTTSCRASLPAKLSWGLNVRYPLHAVSEIGRCYTIDSAVRQRAQFELDTLSYAQPVKIHEQWSDTVTSAASETRRPATWWPIVKSVELTGRQACKNRVTVVQPVVKSKLTTRQSDASVNDGCCVDDAR